MVASDLNVSVGCLKFTYSSLFPTKQVDRLLFLKFLKRNEHTPKSSYLLFFLPKLIISSKYAGDQIRK